MKSTLRGLSAAFIAFLLVLGGALHTAAAQDVSRTFSVSEGEELDLDIETGGEIIIQGWDRNEVTVEIDLDGADARDVIVNIDEFSGGVEVHTEYNSRRLRADVTVRVRVPRRFDIDISTTGGDITIEGVSGSIEGETMGGDLMLTGLSGRLRMSTMGGDVELRDSEVDGSVSTMGGDVEIRNVVGSVSGTTMGGDVTYDNVRSGNGDSRDEVKISTMGGDIEVDEALYGADVHTMGGDIEVRKAGRFVKATTMGGEIVIHEVDGWVEANTMGGDVEVRMTGGTDGDRHVELSSMGGDIELIVPRGLSMRIDAEITLSDDSDDDEFEIVSDFQLETEVRRTSEGRWRNGRTLRATGDVRGGQNRIRIKTIEGSIYIREGN
ncbi:MAG: DUF4097 family beta strand repeat protein [Rhodothermales bacterium]|nr:DUF4097 family beta strand repeat protein [Rhodothermales bacterium]